MQTPTTPWLTNRIRRQSFFFLILLFINESIKGELQIKPISEFWYDESLKTKAEESTRFVYTEYKDEVFETRLVDEKFADSTQIDFDYLFYYSDMLFFFLEAVRNKVQKQNCKAFVGKSTWFVW
jgi:hypothetical protein